MASLGKNNRGSESPSSWRPLHRRGRIGLCLHRITKFEVMSVCQKFFPLIPSPPSGGEG